MKPAMNVRRQKSFGYVNQNGSTSYTFFREGAGPVEVAEAISRDAGGDSWPLKVEGVAVQDFDFDNASDRIYTITWAATRSGQDVQYYKHQLEKVVARQEPAVQVPQPNARQTYAAQLAQPDTLHEEKSVSAADALRAEFTESRAAAVQAEFGQLIIDCLNSMEDTVDTLIAKKVELLKEKARIEATIEALEVRIDGFKTKAAQITEQIDPYEQDIQKLGYN